MAPKSSAAAVLPQNQTVDLEVSLPNRDRLSLHLEIENGSIVQSRLSGIGCTQMLKLMGEWRTKFQGALADVPLPSGQDHSSLLLKEVILKAQGKWNFPYQDEELCHCRAIPTARVDAAIIGGCKSVSAVSRQTSAGTSCGTCRPDIEAILQYRRS